MNIAVIDIGTNTFDLLIAEVEKGKAPKELYSTKISVRLGSGGITKNKILEEAMDRALQALKSYKSTIADYNCTAIHAFATSAVRGAENKEVFVNRVKSETGIEVQVIDGDKEAGYIYIGVKHALQIGTERALIIDIGGGSIEFIIANQDQIFWKYSFNIGVARLLERFKPSDPIDPNQVKEIEDHLTVSLKGLFDAARIYPVNELIGSSGSFETFAEVIAHKMYDPEILSNTTHYTFNLPDYEKVHHQLMASSLEQRKQIKGIIEMRLDMIVMASLVTNFVLKTLKIGRMRLSTYSLKEGVLWEAFNNSFS